ncbi:hypothetical protein DRO66_08995 [Candidatus Bathyarchaeota archaeon]|nr:MAG: hypothetical protein DRO66_08995 [Candidatus Bathyarchaeota archaeon]
MRELILENYKATESRGKIDTFTTHEHFVDKLYEELREVENAESSEIELGKELADVILTAMNYAYHYGIDIEQELYDKVEYNKTRKD